MQKLPRPWVRARGLLAGLIAGATLAAADAQAATFVLDGASGADYDAVGDGWFFGPLDGQGDLGGNALAVGYIAGTLELRAMAEFPLSSLAGLTEDDIASATLTFKIDDVLSTFGPGADFDNTASNPIAVYTYPADGTVNVSDFSPAGLTQVEIVATGTITDTTLTSTQAVTFNVDVTQELKDALTGEDTAFGILLGTADSPTGTSLDNLSPPGGAGGALPIVTIQTVELTPPVFDPDERKCQGAIGKAGASFAKSAQVEFNKCFKAVLQAVANGDPLATTEEKCRKGLDLANPNSKLAKARAKVTSTINGACSDLTPADVESPCDSGAENFGAIATCVVNDHLQNVEQMIKAEYQSACALLDAVGLADDFPSTCNP